MSEERIIPDFLKKASVAREEAGRHIQIHTDSGVIAVDAVASEPAVSVIQEPVAMVQQSSAASPEPVIVAVQEPSSAVSDEQTQVAAPAVEKKSEEKSPQEIMDDIAEGATIVLTSQSGVSHTYFKEDGEFYLESARGKKSMSVKTVEVLKRLGDKKWKLEKTPAVASVTPDSAAEKEKMQPTQGEVSAVKNFNEQSLPNDEKSSEEKKKAEEAIAKMKALEELDGEIKALEGQLVVARNAYAHAKYKSAGAWKRLFQTLGVKPKESDEVPEAAEHRRVLGVLKEKHLKRVQMMKDSFAPSEYKKAMGEALQLFETESQFKLSDAYTEATKERKGLSEKMIGSLEDAGKWYNKQPLWAKVGVGAALMGGAFLSGGSVGALIVPIMARRALGTAGMYTALDPLAEKMLRNRLENKVTERIDAEVKELGESGIPIEILKSKLQGKIDALDKNFLQRKRERLIRKTSIALFAGAIGFGSSLFSNVSEVAEVKDAVKESASVAKAVAENGGDSLSSASEVGAAPQQLGEGALQSGVEMKPGVSLDAAPAAEPVVPSEPLGAALVESSSPSPSVGPYTPLEEPPMDVAEASASVPAVYEIVKGDNTWKILDGYLTDHDPKFAGMTEGQQTHAIDALKDKLKLLSPAQLKEAGFTSGNIDKLRVGDTINLDKLLGFADADKAMTDAGKISADAVQSIESNNAKIADWAKAHPGEAINDRVIDEKILGRGGVIGSDVHGRIGQPELLNSFDDASANRLIRPVSPVEVMPSPSEAPLESMSLSPVEMRRGSDWFMQIFRVDDQVSGKDWIADKKEILGTKMSDILKIESNGVVSVKENTHFNLAQSKNLQEFTSELPKVFPGGRAALSDFLKARPNISVGEYIARVAKVVPQGTRIGLYTTTN